MKAKYRAPAITRDQYALLKIGAMAIRLWVSQSGKVSNGICSDIILEVE